MILAGGTEALSHAPLVWPNSGVRWFAGLATAKGMAAKLAAAFKLRPRYLKPIIGLERGLTDPITELNMGQTSGAWLKASVPPARIISQRPSRM